MKQLLTSILILFQVTTYAQTIMKVDSPLDTLNTIVYGSYPKIHQSSNKGLPDTLLTKFPNRSHVDFDNLSASKRDSMVMVQWIKFKDEFNNSIDFNSINLNKKTKAFFFTLYFSPDGKLNYVFYNWNKSPDHNEAFNKAFIQFVTAYNFTGFPKGKYWSQCGTFAYKKGKPKN